MEVESKLGRRKIQQASVSRSMSVVAWSQFMILVGLRLMYILMCKSGLILQQQRAVIQLQLWSCRFSDVKARRKKRHSETELIITFVGLSQQLIKDPVSFRIPFRGRNIKQSRLDWKSAKRTNGRATHEGEAHSSLAQTPAGV